MFLLEHIHSLTLCSTVVLAKRCVYFLFSSLNSISVCSHILISFSLFLWMNKTGFLYAHVYSLRKNISQTKKSPTKCVRALILFVFLHWDCIQCSFSLLFEHFWLGKTNCSQPHFEYLVQKKSRDRCWWTNHL